MQGGPDTMIGVLMRRGNLDTDIDRRRMSCDHGDKDWHDASLS